MGWFDDSDSDEGGGFGKKSSFSKSKSKKKREREQRRAPPLDFFNDVKDGVDVGVGVGASTEEGANGQEEKEEVDPLDAYMSGITTEASAGKVDGDGNGEDGGGTVKRMRAERLDMENEDEATAHWTNDNGNGMDAVDGATAASRRLLPPPDSDDDDTRDNTANAASASMSTSSRAKMAMASTFHKAGSKPKPTSSNNHNNHQNDNDINHDSDDYDEDDLKRIAEETAKQQRNQSIDPLENVDHASTKYDPFRKSFLPPTATIFTTSAKQWRNDNHVTCSMDLDPIPSFTSLGPPSHNSTNTSNTAAPAASSTFLDLLPLPVIQYLQTAGFRTPTPVQAQGIPVALAGRDLLVTSSTGSGKTLAYSLPILTHILDQPHIVPNQDGPIALILAPTRELARQIHLLLKKLLSLVGGTAIAVAGGNEGTYELSRKLKRGCEAVVSTPGRFIDLVKRGATNCTRVTLLVLDEADRMLHMGFEEQVGSILRNVRPDRQSFLFSATFDKRLEKVASRWLKDPVRIAIGRTGSSSEHVTQHVLVLPTREAKKQWMAEMLPVLAELGKTIIFVSSRADCDELAHYLHQRQQQQQSQSSLLPIDYIHGERHQSDRNAALSALKKGKLAALVATDVAARGLDVPDIATVVNFDPAKNWDSHVHRVGRAGRLSRRSTDSDGEPQQQQQQKKGSAYTLLTPKNADFAKVLVDAFEREQREVSEELVQLARKSRRFVGGAGGQRWNRSGLGFHQGAGSGPSPSIDAKTADGYYGPSRHYGPST